jgi:hypothetical protein
MSNQGLSMYAVYLHLLLPGTAWASQAASMCTSETAGRNIEQPVL